MSYKGIMKGIPKHLPEFEYPFPIFLLTKSTKINRYPTIGLSIFAPVFMLQMDFHFKVFKTSVDLTQHLWLYDMIYNNHLVFCIESKYHLLKNLSSLTQN